MIGDERRRPPLPAGAALGREENGLLPAAFEYRAPTSLDEAISVLTDGGEDARVIAGGQSLIPMMKLRFATPALLIDLARVPGLDGIEETDGHLRVGAMVRTAELETSEVIRSRYPAMAAAAALISDPLVRNRGTIGGSLAHADPAGDWGSVILALDGEVVLKSSSGERTVAVDDFLADTFTTTIEPGEIVTEVRVPVPGERFGGSYHKLERKVGDFATVAAAATLEIDGERVSRVGIGLTAVAPRNLKAKDAEQGLRGAEPTDEALDEAAGTAAEIAEPVDDVRGSAEYKRDALRVLVRRALADSREMALEA
jgi:aerobic carbon-monoxide dehydrogenase medium subunit